MSQHTVQISSDITISFSSNQVIPSQHVGPAALQSFLSYCEGSGKIGWSILHIAGKVYRFRYEIIAERALQRATMYNEAIQYIRSQRGITFNPILADYAIQKLLEMLERDW
jgi:hypothetical protein